MTPPFETLSAQRCFGGTQGFYRHESAETGGTMKFSVFVPEAAARAPLPVVYFLAGLTCTEETFAIKAGAQRHCVERGVILVTCDTSPRSARYPGDDESWDFGVAAGFYLDATEAPWRATYRMESYLLRELMPLVEEHFPVAKDARGIFGHSMGGHGALTLALRHPALFRSVSALAPIVAPSQVPWGQKAFSRYLGENREIWREHDACELVARGALSGRTLLIDQGMSDKFLERELRPELFEAACASAGQALTLRRHEGYDHSYWFIQTFVGDHIAFHARGGAP
jgi:S-formylglutathione hydrolase